MALKPWDKVVTPRENLREGKPLDASEFAVQQKHEQKLMQAYADMKGKYGLT
jgi:hypothetical protein